MFKYLQDSIKRKVARRITKRYPTRIDTFHTENYGDLKFANWENPLVKNTTLTAKNIGFARKFLNEGDAAIDIGANIGLQTVIFSIITGKKGLTLSFDPNPYVFEVLMENVKLYSHVANIHAHNMAITGEDGDYYYNSSEASFNNGGISKEKDTRHGKYSLNTKIKGIKLETFLEKNYSEFIDKIKLVKIDTEGYDKEIIKSIHGFLKKYKPVVITECFGKLTPEERFEQFNLLKSIGYSLYYFSDFVSDADIIPIREKEDMLKWKHFDLYAIAE
jgi:FkbM family methyltransferase